MQRGDLLRDQPDQKQRQGVDQQHGAHVGEAVHGEVGVSVVPHAEQQKRQAQRQEEPHRREQRANLEDDEHKPGTVPQHADVAFAAAPPGPDRDVGHRKPGAEKGHRAGGGVGKAVGQQIEEFAKMASADGAKAGGEILNVVPGHPGGQAVVAVIGETSAQ